MPVAVAINCDPPVVLVPVAVAINCDPPVVLVPVAVAQERDPPVVKSPRREGRNLLRPPLFAARLRDDAVYGKMISP